MRLSTLALATILSSAAAFAPQTPTTFVRESPIMAPLSMTRESNQFDQAKQGVLSLFSASVLLLSTVAGPAIEPAMAAAPITTTPTTTQTTKKEAPTVKSVDPLATEKAAVESAKAALTKASSTNSVASKALADANVAYVKASTAVSGAEKKATSAKKAVIAANDKLADAKAKEGSGSANAIKEVENLASKVGTSFQFVII